MTRLKKVERLLRAAEAFTGQAADCLHEGRQEYIDMFDELEQAARELREIVG